MVLPSQHILISFRISGWNQMFEFSGWFFFWVVWIRTLASGQYWMTFILFSDYNIQGSKGENSGIVGKEKVSSIYQNETLLEPCSFSSSIYYGGQDVYSPQTWTAESHPTVSITLCIYPSTTPYVIFFLYQPTTNKTTLLILIYLWRATAHRPKIGKG